MGEQTVVVTLHAPFSDLAGARQIVVALAEPISGEALLRRLGEQFPRLAPQLAEGPSHEDLVLLVIDGKACRRDAVVRPGDKVSLFAQVSGG